MRQAGSQIHPRDAKAKATPAREDGKASLVVLLVRLVSSVPSGLMVNKVLVVV
jgi:hypothetical protein